MIKDARAILGKPLLQEVAATSCLSACNKRDTYWMAVTV